MLGNLLNLLGFKPKSPPPMTLQQAYEKIRAHFIAQNERAVDGTYMCRYRTKTGLTCAVGCLITDDNYNPDMEGKSLSSRMVQDAVEKSTGLDLVKGGPDMTEAGNFLYFAQNIHDRKVGDNELATKGVFLLDDLARRYELNVKA